MEKVNTKQKLFETMQKINPDFKILNEGAPFSENSLINRAFNNLITQEEYFDNKELFDRAAQKTVDDFSDWEVGQGFGSSDMTAALKVFLDNAEIKNAYVDNRLTRLQEQDLVQQPVQAQSGDVANLQKVVNANTTIQYADSRIDTPQELQDAFGTWLSRTGYGLSRKPVRALSISQMQTYVRNAMTKLGYK
jgi:hypothetical protein